MKSEIFLYVVMFCLIDYVVEAQGQPGFPQTQFRQRRQYDQTGQVQPPTYGSSYQTSYDPNPYQTNNIPPGQR